MFLKNKITQTIGQFANHQGEDWIELIQEEIFEYLLKINKERKTDQCIKYLASTDWQIIRLADPTSDEPLKEGVAEKRQLARSLQNDISACETLEELEQINVNL